MEAIHFEYPRGSIGDVVTRPDCPLVGLRVSVSGWEAALESAAVTFETKALQTVMENETFVLQSPFPLLGRVGLTLQLRDPTGAQHCIESKGHVHYTLLPGGDRWSDLDVPCSPEPGQAGTAVLRRLLGVERPDLGQFEALFADQLLDALVPQVRPGTVESFLLAEGRPLFSDASGRLALVSLGDDEIALEATDVSVEHAFSQFGLVRMGVRLTHRRAGAGVVDTAEHRVHLEAVPAEMLAAAAPLASDPKVQELAQTARGLWTKRLQREIARVGIHEHLIPDSAPRSSLFRLLGAYALGAPTSSACSLGERDALRGEKRNPALEQRIVENPKNADAYLIYADWLRENGEQRGDLVTLQHAVSAAPDDKNLKRRADELAVQFTPALGRRYFNLRWKLGFIEEASIATDEMGHAYDADAAISEILAGFLEHPSSRFLQGLRVGFAAETPLDSAIPALVKLKPLALRRLCLGEQGEAYEDEDGNEVVPWSRLGDVSSLYAALPRLESLTLESAELGLGQIVLPELRECVIRTERLDPAAVQAICTARWPKLERLEVWIGMSDGAIEDVASIRPILQASGLANLKHLGLVSTLFTDELVTALPHSTILRQLESLDLSKGSLSSAGVEAMLEHRQAFKHLKLLDVSDSDIPKRVKKRLVGLCAEVKLESAQVVFGLE